MKIIGVFNWLKRFQTIDFEVVLNYNFKDKSMLNRALSHRSYVHNIGKDKTLESNERLEFLGDAVLDLVVTEYLYQNYTKYPEGTLSKMKSLIVSAKVLSKCAQRWNLGKYLLLSSSENKSGGRERESILSDGFEAVLGSIYLDGGLKVVKKIIEKVLVPILEEVLGDEELANYKSQLLEFTQSINKGVPQYRVMEEKGPEHKKEFKIGVYILDEQWGEGSGMSKKSAEQSAARMAFQKFSSQIKD